MGRRLIGVVDCCLFSFPIVIVFFCVMVGCSVDSEKNTVDYGDFDRIQNVLPETLKPGLSMADAQHALYDLGLRKRIDVDPDTTMFFADAPGPSVTSFRLQVVVHHANGEVIGWKDSVIGTGL